MQSHPKPEQIAHITKQQLSPGAILKLFAGGSRAVCLHDDSRIRDLWNRIVLNDPPEPTGGNGWKEFWNNSVFTFVKNHFKNKTDYGDLFWFEPENYGYISRKIVTYPDPQSGKMRVCPETLFNDNNQIAELSQDTLKLAWDFSMEILKAACPQEQLDSNEFVIHIELLKYPNSYPELLRFYDFVTSGSSWKRIGMKVDLSKSRARGPFKTPYVMDVFAWLSWFPIIGKILNKINSSFLDEALDKTEEGYAPVGQSHVDGCRFITILASERDAMKTEAWGEKGWEEMPMTNDSFVIFPGAFYDPTDKIKPTLHRYSIRKQPPENPTRKLNLTFCIGISTKKMFEERRPR